MALLGVIFLAIIAGRFWGYGNEFKSEGFERASLGLGHSSVTLSNKGDAPKYCYLGNSIRLQGTIDGDLAVMARSLVVAGTVEGTLHFRGQKLIILEGGQVKKLNVRCQSVAGSKKAGELVGSWQELQEATAAKEKAAP